MNRRNGQHLKLFSYLLVLLFLSGCTAAFKPVTAVNQSANDAKLIALTHWELKGRMAFKSQQESVSAYVRWVQNKQNFSLTLTNVIGVTILSLSFDGSIATLDVDGEQYTHTDPQQLLFDVSGWEIPVNRLSYWVKGLAAATDKTRRTSDGLVTQITSAVSHQNNRTNPQALWKVDFGQYAQEKGIVLPRNLTISQNLHAVSIKLKINEWTII